MSYIPFRIGRYCRITLFFFLLCRISLPAGAQWSTPDASGNIYNTNSGNVGIGTTTPQVPLEVHVTGTLGTTAGSTSEITRLYSNTGNGSQLRFYTYRYAAGNSWLTASTRVQAWTDVTPQAYIDFNPNGGLYALAFGSGSSEFMRITQTGNIGIWTNSPQTSLEVHSAASLGTSAGSIAEIARFYSGTGNGSQLRFLTSRYANGTDWTSASTRVQAVTDGTNQGYIDFNPGGGASGVAFGSGSAELMRIMPSGNVLIGKVSQANTGYLLDVNGSARINQVVVNTTGADFVFDTAYRMAPLSEVEAYIRQQHHLPDISPAGEMEKEGLDVGENQTKLLQKIEELTLYIIEQNKRMRVQEERAEVQNQQLKEQHVELKTLQEQISRLEKLIGQKND